MFCGLPVQPAEKVFPRDNDAPADLERREICTVGELVRSGSGNAKGGSNISFPPYLQLAPRRWGTARTELGSSHSSWKGSLLLSTPATAACLTSKQTAVLSALLVIQLSWIVIPPPYFSYRAPKGALRPLFGRSAPSLLFMVRFGIFCCRQDFLLCFT